MQNKIYIDANIMLDLLFEHRECSINSANLLREFLKNDTYFVTNNLNLNTIFYVGAERNSSYGATKDFLKTIHTSEIWQIYDLMPLDREFALEFMDKNNGADFEDLLQYSAAKNSGCKFIITNDNNFPKLDIPLKRTNPNLEDYLPV